MPEVERLEPREARLRDHLPQEPLVQPERAETEPTRIGERGRNAREHRGAADTRAPDLCRKDPSCNPGVPRPSPPGSESADDLHVSTEVPYISAAIGLWRTFAS